MMENDISQMIQQNINYMCLSCVCSVVALRFVHYHREPIWMIRSVSSWLGSSARQCAYGGSSLLVRRSHI